MAEREIVRILRNNKPTRDANVTATLCCIYFFSSLFSQTELVGHLIEARTATTGILPQTIGVRIGCVVAAGGTREDSMGQTLVAGYLERVLESCYRLCDLVSSKFVNGQIKTAIGTLVQDLVPMGHALPLFRFQDVLHPRCNKAWPNVRTDTDPTPATTIIKAAVSFGSQIQNIPKRDIE